MGERRAWWSVDGAWRGEHVETWRGEVARGLSWCSKHASERRTQRCMRRIAHRAADERVLARAVVVGGCWRVVDRIGVVAAAILAHVGQCAVPAALLDMGGVVVGGGVGAAVDGVDARPRRLHGVAWLGRAACERSTRREASEKARHERGDGARVWDSRAIKGGERIVRAAHRGRLLRSSSARANSVTRSPHAFAVWQQSGYYRGRSC